MRPQIRIVTKCILDYNACIKEGGKEVYNHSNI